VKRKKPVADKQKKSAVEKGQSVERVHWKTGPFELWLYYEIMKAEVSTTEDSLLSTGKSVTQNEIGRL
jgi:hypothetical protein